MDKRRIAGTFLALTVMIAGCRFYSTATPAVLHQTDAVRDAAPHPPTVITPNAVSRVKAVLRSGFHSDTM